MYKSTSEWVPFLLPLSFIPIYISDPYLKDTPDLL